MSSAYWDTYWRTAEILLPEDRVDELRDELSESIGWDIQDDRFSETDRDFHGSRIISADVRFSGIELDDMRSLFEEFALEGSMASGRALAAEDGTVIYSALCADGKGIRELTNYDEDVLDWLTEKVLGPRGDEPSAPPAPADPEAADLREEAGAFVASFLGQAVEQAAEDVLEVPVSVRLDSSPVFEAYADPDREWNGWACPYFELSDANKVMDFVNSPATDDSMVYDAEADSFICYAQGDREDWEAFQGIERGGRHVYPIGTGSWVWTIEPSAPADRAGLDAALERARDARAADGTAVGADPSRGPIR